MGIGTELTEKEKKILQMLYGAGDGFAYTLDEIGFVFNLPAKEIDKIRKNALKKIPNSEIPVNVIRCLH